MILIVFNFKPDRYGKLMYEPEDAYAYPYRAFIVFTFPPKDMLRGIIRYTDYIFRMLHIAELQIHGTTQIFFTGNDRICFALGSQLQLGYTPQTKKLALELSKLCGEEMLANCGIRFLLARVSPSKG